MASELVEAANGFRQRLATREAQAMRRLARAYGQMYTRLEVDLSALLAQLANVDGEIATGTVMRRERIEALKRQIAQEVNRYGFLADAELDDVTQDALNRAAADSRRLVQLALPDGMVEAGVGLRWHRLPRDVIEQLLGFLSPESPMRRALTTTLGTEVADRVADTLVNRVGLGWNPRRIASEIRRVHGQALTWSLRTVRTAQNWAYREATRASYVANAEVVKGWIWQSALDNRTCLGCLAMHGTRHGLDEELNDHHNGRCVMLPEVVTYKELGLDVEQEPLDIGNGQEWFEAQGEAVQREMMGPGKFEAWKAGKFEFGRLAGHYQDDVYGDMRVEASLKELLGGAT